MSNAVNSPVQSALDLWTVTATTTGAATATANRVAGGAGVRHVAKRVIISLCGAGAAAQPPINIALMDGTATLAQFTMVAAAVSTSQGFSVLDLNDLDLAGTANSLMSLTSPNLGANSNISMTLIGYDLGGARPVAIPSYTT
jgi:hypothetical protein